MIKTYLDANVLIVAFRGEHPAADAALTLLGEGHRQFVASPYLRLETLRKPRFHRRQDEVEFMETYFATVAHWVPSDDRLVQRALELAARLDLGAMDALHAAAALQGGAEVFVTMERRSKPLFRIPGLVTLSLNPEQRSES